MSPREGPGPIANAIGIAAGITLGGVIVKARPQKSANPRARQTTTPAGLLSPAPAPFLDADVAPPSRAFPQRLNETGADVARLSFPRLPQRRKTVEVTLGEGQTVGELVCKYVGEYTEENMNLTREMNRGRLDDLDFVVPGTVIKLADNRKPKLATPEAEWWNERGMGAAPREAAGAAMDVDAEEPRDANGAALSATPPSRDDDDKENVGARSSRRGARGAAKKRAPKMLVNPDGVDMRVPEADAEPVKYR
jgi:hypothetical protein